MGDSAFAQFRGCVTRYLDFNWRHLNLEEDELLPIARRDLTREDWAEIDAAFAANFDPFAGPNREFAALFDRIVELAPREALFKMPLHPYTAALMSAIPLPDPVRERARERTVLKGETPDPAAIPPGCRFNNRCPRATDLCRQVDPAMRLFAPGHQVACHHPLSDAGLP